MACPFVGNFLRVAARAGRRVRVEYLAYQFLQVCIYSNVEPQCELAREPSRDDRIVYEHSEPPHRSVGYYRLSVSSSCSFGAIMCSWECVGIRVVRRVL